MKEWVCHCCFGIHDINEAGIICRCGRMACVSCEVRFRSHECAKRAPEWVCSCGAGFATYEAFTEHVNRLGLLHGDAPEDAEPELGPLAQEGPNVVTRNGEPLREMLVLSPSDARAFEEYLVNPHAVTVPKRASKLAEWKRRYSDEAMLDEKDPSRLEARQLLLGDFWSRWASVRGFVHAERTDTCIACGSRVFGSFGLAGGGYGPYFICEGNAVAIYAPSCRAWWKTPRQAE